jgi:hypothetical protein
MGSIVVASFKREKPFGNALCYKPVLEERAGRLFGVDTDAGHPFAAHELAKLCAYADKGCIAVFS